jgi:photosystem II stability/assembly factor-like uncharacterized protein
MVHRLIALVLVVLTAGISSQSARAGNQLWTGTGPRAKSVEAIARDRLNPSRMWAATFGAGVFRSLDGGATWTGYRTGLVNTYVRCLAVNPHHPDSIFCGTNDGVHLSIDGGVTWKRVLPTSVSVRAVTIHPIRTAVVYAATYGTGIYKSVAGGDTLTWNTINLGLSIPGSTNVRDVAIHPAKPETLFAATGTGAGVFRSFNGGLTWSQVPDPTATAGAAEQIQIDRQDPQIVYVAELERGVLKSTNGGDSWSTINKGLPTAAKRTRSIAVVDTLRYLGTDGSGVFFTTLNDTTWHATGLTSGQVDGLFASASTPDTIWAGLSGEGILRSDNRGATWTPIDGGLLVTFGFSLTVRPSSNALYDGTGFGDQFWRSTDQNATWIRTSFIFTHDSEREVVIDPILPQTLYLSAYGSGVYRSGDDGVTWIRPDSLSSPDSLGNRFVRPLVAWPSRFGRLLVGAGNGVWETRDGAVTWKSKSTGLPATVSVRSLAVAAGPVDTLLYVGSEAFGVYRGQYVTPDNISWTPKNNGLTNLFIHELRVDQTSPTTIFAGTEAGVFKTTDGGETWAPSSNGLPAAASVRTIIQEPSHPALLFCGTFGDGVFESADKGQSWVALFGQRGLPSLNVYSLAVDAGLSTLYAGTDEGVAAFTSYPLQAMAVDGSPVGPELALSVWPNPARSTGVEVRYGLPRPGPARLAVYGVSGRRVRVLIDRKSDSAGVHIVAWNRRDAGGRTVAPGLYFLRLESAEGVRAARLVIASR